MQGNISDVYIMHVNNIIAGTNKEGNFFFWGGGGFLPFSLFFPFPSLLGVYFRSLGFIFSPANMFAAEISS